MICHFDFHLLRQLVCWSWLCLSFKLKCSIFYVKDAQNELHHRMLNMRTKKQSTKGCIINVIGIFRIEKELFSVLSYYYLVLLLFQTYKINVSESVMKNVRKYTFYLFNQLNFTYCIWNLCVAKKLVFSFFPLHSKNYNWLTFIHFRKNLCSNKNCIIVFYILYFSTNILKLCSSSTAVQV